MGTTISDSAAQDAANAYHEHGSIPAVAEAKGWHYDTARKRIKAASVRGMLGTEPVLPGYYISKETAIYDADGHLTREFIQQKPEPTEEFEMPNGHELKGVSALVDANGNTIQKWIKTNKDKPTVEQTAQAVQDAFSTKEFVPTAAPKYVPDCDTDRLTVYPIADWHIGLFAWGDETGGPDWDLKIARKVFKANIDEIVSQTPPSEHALVLGLGDLMHADDTKFAFTPQNQNLLDTDTRYQKCLFATSGLVRYLTERVAAKHNKVSVALKRGNHDPTSTVALTLALSTAYEDVDRIDVDPNPDAFFWKRFGVNLIGGVHGDGLKIDRLPMIMAKRCKKDWAVAKTHHIHCGHRHHDHSKEIEGVMVYQHRAPVAQDVYHAWHGYLAGRSMYAFNYHKKLGFRGSTEVEIH